VFHKLRYDFNKTQHVRLNNLPHLTRPCMEDIVTSVVTKRFIAPGNEKHIRMRYWDSFFIDGSKQTMALDAVVNFTSPYVQDWRGPLVFHDIRSDCAAAWDLDTTGFQHIVDFLNTSKAPVDAKNMQKSLEMLHEEMAKWTPRYQQKALAAEELEVRRKRAEAAAKDNEMDDDTDEEAYEQAAREWEKTQTERAT
jgi:hypothetical protein